mmetsp:Transcript_19147/g.44835  ORF Transcript_19147/g.44835 Transcript_19147/m.44835 type:complete len:89 (-) Transcript_19147:392-658(-)
MAAVLEGCGERFGDAVSFSEKSQNYHTQRTPVTTSAGGLAVFPSSVTCRGDLPPTAANSSGASQHQRITASDTLPNERPARSNASSCG